MTAAPPRGAAIDVFNFGGERSQRYRQHPPGGLPSTSSTSVMAAVGPVGSTPKGSAIDVFNFGSGRCRRYRQHPLGACNRRLQLWWWPLPKIPPAPPGDLPSTFSTSVLAAAGPAVSTPQGFRHRRLQHRWWPLLDLPAAPPRGPAIDVSNFWTSSPVTSWGPLSTAE
jgi:hypothetical protein